MKKIKIISLLLFVIALQTQAQRSIQDFNKGWKFKLGDNNANKNMVLNDASWPFDVDSLLFR